MKLFQGRATRRALGLGTSTASTTATVAAIVSTSASHIGRKSNWHMRIQSRGQVWHAQTNGMGVASVTSRSTTPFVPQGVPPDVTCVGREHRSTR